MPQAAGRGDTAIVAVLLADVALEATDVLTFLTMAFVAEPRPHGGELVPLAALILPRVAFALLGTLVLRARLRDARATAAPTLAFLALVTVQGTAGLFLLWGAGASLPARSLVASANLVALAAAATTARSRTAAGGSVGPTRTDG